MKRIFYFLVMLTLPVFVACSDKDDEPPTFVWDGDWNDPEHENYTGYYNPVEGLWKNIQYPKGGLDYTKDFELYTVIFADNGNFIRELWDIYKINDKAYELKFSGIWRYKLEGDKLTIYPNRNDNKDAREYRKVEE